MTANLIRCSWCGVDPLYVEYHDAEWGVPVHDDRILFEFLTLEGAQAGLSWITVLRKREKYRELFHDWDIEEIANMKDEALENILLDPGVVRNRLKVYSVRKNAVTALQIQKEFGSLDIYFWSNSWFHSSPEKVSSSPLLGDELYRRRRQGGVLQKGIPQSVTPSNSPFSGGENQIFPIINHPQSLGDFVAESEVSQKISKDLKKRGMSFVGSTIIYAWMQAVGMVDDHIDGCFRKNN